MVIENINTFGNFFPGDQLVIPEGSVFDSSYWREVDIKEEIPEDNKPETNTPEPVEE